MKLSDLVEQYSEGRLSTFTCPTGTYYVDDLIEFAANKPTVDFDLSHLTWMLSEPVDQTRVDHADPTVPVIVNEYEPNQWATLDGFHRVRNAISSGSTSIPAKIVTNDELSTLKEVSESL